MWTNLIFALIVSHNFFGWTLTQCIMCAFTGAIVELLCEIVFSPLRLRISNAGKKRVSETNILAKYPVKE